MPRLKHVHTVPTFPAVSKPGEPLLSSCQRCPRQWIFERRGPSKVLGLRARILPPASAGVQS